MPIYHPRRVVVHDLMQQGYVYECVAPVGKQFDPAFRPQLTPKQMLALGVFGGRYLRDCGAEFPKDWFTCAKFAVGRSDPKQNYFKVKASQSLAVWRRNGWINQGHDPRGWFQWYCRYYLGRRLPKEDARQIRRWRAIARHASQIRNSCSPGDLTCRPGQRQALLHWAYDSRKI